MNRPLIGLTTDHNDQRTRYVMPELYVKGVELAGGTPLLIPYKLGEESIWRIVKALDGIILIGGDDLDPTLFGQPPHPGIEPIDPQRTRFELGLLAEVERVRKPVLGICFGCQLMNVHRGGSLHQFLPDVPGTLEHRRGEQGWNRRHEVRVESDSLLAKALGATCLQTNTSHKQAVDRVGRGLRVVATSADGVIEGLQDPLLPFYLGVQWHPERLLDEPAHRRLFESLVKAAHG
jgi:putative glutamine amidotransferase